jgi:DNA-binding FadR family transcriptional regulator
MKVVPVQHRSAADHVRSHLIELIETRQFAVNDRLPSEAELAASFGVSRSVIREALHSLHTLGLTRSRAGRGTYVAATRPQSPLVSGHYETGHLDEVRRHLEVAAAGLAAGRCPPEALAELAGLAQQFDDAADPQERLRVDERFHTAVAEASGNPLLAQLIDDLRTVRSARAAEDRAVEAPPTDLHPMVEAIRAGDGGRAEQAARGHRCVLDPA